MKYMVLFSSNRPEYLEADGFEIDERRILSLYVNHKQIAAFVDWLGIKESDRPAATFAMTATTTNQSRTSNPTRAKIRIREHFETGTEPLVLGTEQSPLTKKGGVCKPPPFVPTPEPDAPPVQRLL